MTQTRSIVHLVRHGEVENPRGISYGRLPGFSLSALGRRQARAVGLTLQAHDFDVILSSPLERAVETATLLLMDRASPALHLDDRLIEIGSWKEGLPRRVSPVAYAKQYFDKDVRGKTEPAREVVARMRLVIDDLLARGCESVVLVSHQAPIWLIHAAYVGGLNRVGRTRLGAGVGGLAPWLFVRPPPETGSITTLRFDGGGHFIGVEYSAPRSI